MAISAVYKMRIIGYMKRCPSDKLCYPTMCKYVNAREKITYLEYLEFFLEYVMTELKKDKISLSLLNKIILTLTSFIEWSVSDGFVVTKEILDKVSMIRSLYDDYIKRSNEERFVDLDENIGLMEDKVKELFPEYEYVEREEETVLLDVEELLEQIAILKREIEEYRERIAELEKANKGHESAISKREKKYTKVLAALDKKDKKVAELIKQLNDAYGKIDELKLIGESKDKEIVVLSEQNEGALKRENELRIALVTLNKELKKFRRLLLEKEKEILGCRQAEKEILKKEAERLKVELEYKEIEEVLIKRMLLGYSNNEELILYVRNIGYKVSDEEIIGLVNRIRFSGILDSLRVKEQEFVTVFDKVSESVYNVSLDSCLLCYDLVVVSDFHLEQFNSSIMEDMDILYDYCTVNKIPLIVNAGDFFSFKHYNKSDGLVKATELEWLIDKVIERYPRSKGISQVILGGNHDKDAISYGMDPIELLTKNRDDFVNLGYGHAILNFFDSDIKGIGVHHPNRRYQDFIGSEGYDSSEVEGSLESYYRRSSIVDRDSVYVDILGHIHKSSLDVERGICIVPSYRNDRVCNGAWHLKIFFDMKGNIKEMVFIPLVKGKKLIPVTEIGYKKKLELIR